MVTVMKEKHMRHWKTPLALCLIFVPAILFANGSGDAQTIAQSLLGAQDDRERELLIDQLQIQPGEAARSALEIVASTETQEASIRMQAMCALYGMGDRDTAELFIPLLEQDIAERQGFWACLIPTLGAIGDRRAIPLLLRIARQDDDHLAGMDHMAITAIAEMANLEDVGFLESRAHIYPVRPEVIVALARLGASSSTDILISGLADGEENETVVAAEQGLLAMGQDAREALKAAAENQPDAILGARVQALLAQLEE